MFHINVFLRAHLKELRGKIPQTQKNTLFFYMSQYLNRSGDDFFSSTLIHKLKSFSRSVFEDDPQIHTYGRFHISRLYSLLYSEFEELHTNNNSVISKKYAVHTELLHECRKHFLDVLRYISEIMSTLSKFSHSWSDNDQVHSNLYSIVLGHLFTPKNFLQNSTSMGHLLSLNYTFLLLKEIID